jgi:hypothetical protein
LTAVVRTDSDASWVHIAYNDASDCAVQVIVCDIENASIRVLDPVVHVVDFRYIAIHVHDYGRTKRHVLATFDSHFFIHATKYSKKKGDRQ